MELTPMATVRLPIDLSGASLSALTHDLECALASPAPVVTLLGADAETFCLGLAVGAGTQDSTPTHAFAELLTKMHHAPKPLAAVVNGRAIGGGMGLACACDYVVATERATFGLPELLWGLMPAIIWPVLTDRMAPHAVRQWTISAYARGATEAHAAGLVDELIPSASPLPSRSAGATAAAHLGARIAPSRSAHGARYGRGHHGRHAARARGP
jgi:enoyl-CoA hydratase/carnithine racemase